MISLKKYPSGGCILISQPSLTDRFFGKSVVMLAEHGPEGTFGFIVNKPARVELSTVTQDFTPFETEIYLGGPVNIDTLFFVHNKGPEIEGSFKITEGVYWGGESDVIRQMMLTGQITRNDIRFYAGYSGWGAGQLDRELKENSWIILDGNQQHVFGNKPGELWKNIVRSLGKEYSHWINYPADPQMN